MALVSMVWPTVASVVLSGRRLGGDSYNLGGRSDFHLNVDCRGQLDAQRHAHLHMLLEAFRFHRHGIGPGKQFDENVIPLTIGRA